METHVTRQPVLGELRQHVLAALFGNPLFEEAEQVRANHFVHECEDAARLTRWHANVLAEIARRAAAAAHQRQDTLCATPRHFRLASFRGHCPCECQPAPTWVPGAPLADRRGGTFARAAARFQLADSLTLARLLPNQAP